MKVNEIDKKTLDEAQKIWLDQPKKYRGCSFLEAWGNSEVLFFLEQMKRTIPAPDGGFAVPLSKLIRDGYDRLMKYKPTTKF